MSSPNEKDERGLDRRRFLEGVAATAAGIGITGALARHVAADEEEERPEGVQQRTLGRTGLSVSSVIYGGGGLRPESSRLLKAAWDRGLNTFDVAWAYGNGQAETAVGQFMEGFQQRDKVVITTKAYGFRPPRGNAQVVYRALKERV
ncbi:MAG: aldo/keto reductase, partial [Planctomycetota bacterium]